VTLLPVKFFVLLIDDRAVVAPRVHHADNMVAAVVSVLTGLSSSITIPSLL
jgi:hypothetical protein